MKLVQVAEDDAGNYTCLAVNEAGAVFLNFTLGVHDMKWCFGSGFIAFVFFLTLFSLMLPVDFVSYSWMKEHDKRCTDCRPIKIILNY